MSAGAGHSLSGSSTAFGIRLAHPVPQLVPQRGGLGPAGIVLDQGVRHVDAEPGDATVQPERDDLAQRRPVRPRAGRVHRLAPRLVRVRPRVPEVQGGLLLVEVLPVVAGAAARRGHERVARPVGPDVAVVGGIVRGRPEPRVVDRGVPGDQVEQDPDPAPPRLVYEPDHVVVGAVPRGDPQIVRDVVAGVAERRGEARVEPDRVDAQPGQVVEVRDDAGQVTDPVAVRVGERLRIDPVDDRVPQPRFCRHPIIVAGLPGPAGRRGCGGPPPRRSSPGLCRRRMPCRGPRRWRPPRRASPRRARRRHPCGRPPRPGPAGRHHQSRASHHHPTGP